MPHPHDDLDFAQTLQGGGQPTLLGRYRVVRELGHGGMGSVYLAEDTQLDGRLVAIKMPSAILAHNKRAVADLKREATTAMALSHPAIVTLRSFEQSDDGVFLVMDYVEGETLEDRLADKGTLSPEEVVKLLKPVAEALDYAHGRRVIHRDLKPANILIDEDGRAHLTDFGIAREMKDTMTRVTGRQDTSGTLPYMSPEQVNGENPTPAQDIYSFGAMLYECLAGHPPFYRGQIEHQILNREADPVPDSPLAQHIMACLAKQPEARPGKAAALFARAATAHGGAGVPPADSDWLRSKGQTTQSKLYSSPTQANAVSTDASRVLTPQQETAPSQPHPIPAPIQEQQPEGQPEEETGCFAGLVALLLVAAFFAAAIWAATTAPGWAGVGRAALVGLPCGVILHLFYGRKSEGAGLSSVLTETVFCTIVACLTGAVVVNFDSIKAWGLSLTQQDAATQPLEDVADEAAAAPSSPHAERPDEPIMVGATYAADLGDGVELVLTYIPSTEEMPAIRGRGFTMGSAVSEPERADDETLHRVVLTQPFLMSVTEVTQSQWEVVMDTNFTHLRESGGYEDQGSLGQGENYPMSYVSWEDAVLYCERLTELERESGRLPAGWSYRLPTEAEWEWACRAGSAEKYHSGGAESDLNRVGWYNRNSNGPKPVALKAANVWGLYDMHGNVLEWCSDWLGPYSFNNVSNPYGPEVGRNRVLRGGGWRSIAKYCRAARRSGADPEFRGSSYGFRVVLQRSP